MTEDLAALANKQWRDAYRVLIDQVGGEWRDFGTVHAFISSIPLPFANGCLVLETAAADDLETAIEWVDAANLPYRVRVDEHRGAGVLDVPGRLGMTRDPEPMPGMVLTPIPGVPAPAAGVEIVRVDAGTYSVFIEMLVATGVPEEWARPAFPQLMVDDPAMALFVARLDGRPVGTSLAMHTDGDLAGIYAVGTKETARGRGAGTAATWACVAAAREWGCHTVVLQASQMGHPIYRRMGFQSVVEYARFIPAGAGTAATF